MAMMSAQSEPDLDWPAIEAGVRQFNEGDYFAAHESWEHAWMAIGATDLRRPVIQALVQIAAGLHKWTVGVAPGAVKSLSRALDNLDRGSCPALESRFDLVDLRQQVLHLARHAESVERGTAAEQAWLASRIQVRQGLK